MKRADMVCDQCGKKIAEMFCSEEIISVIANIDFPGHRPEGERFGNITCIECLVHGQIEKD
jgi:hypothetical protein